MSGFHFYRPIDESMIIWRYMDFPRFFSLLSKSALYFHPAVLLRQIEPFEFRMPLQPLTAARATLRQQLLELLETEEQAERLTCRMTSQDAGIYNWAVNCWTANPTESYALWKTFVPNSEGVAIRSTVGRLKASLDPASLLYGGLVDYIDHLTDGFTPNEHSFGLEPIFHKARFYQHEQEFRVVTVPNFEIGQHLVPEAFSNPRTLESLLVKANITALIDEVIVSPYASAWFHSLVRDFVGERFDGKISVTESTMLSARALD